MLRTCSALRVSRDGDSGVPNSLLKDEFLVRAEQVQIRDDTIGYISDAYIDAPTSLGTTAAPPRSSEGVAAYR